MFACDFVLSVIFVSLHPQLTPDNVTKVCSSFSWRSLSMIDMTASRLGRGNKYDWSCSDSCCPPTQIFAQKKGGQGHTEIGSICQSPAFLMEKPKIKSRQCNAKVQQYPYWKKHNSNEKKKNHSFDGDLRVASSSILLKSNISVLIWWMHWQSQYIYNSIHLFVMVIIKLFCNIFKACCEEGSHAHIQHK